MNINVNVTIFFTIVSLFYSILLSIAFFSKQRIKLKENNIYSGLIIVNFIGIILELMCTIFAGYAENHLTYYTVLNKMYLLILITWNLLFSMYVYFVSFIEFNLKKIKKIFSFIYLAFVTLVLSSKLEFSFKNGIVMYSYGNAVNIVYLFIILVIIFMIICVIKNHKNIKNKKYYPLYAFLILGGATGIIQMIFPELLLATAMETFITVIMYFTIENPDKKLLEEVHKSKTLIEQSNEEKTIFLYNMTNDIKQIASDINISLNMILSSNNIDETKDYAREVISSNNRLYTLANNIYNIDEIELKNIKVVKTKYNIKLLLKELVTIYKNKLKENNIDFRIKVDSNLPDSLYGDSINLKEILTTILDNAYKYTEKGYIEINVNAIIKQDIARLIIKIEDSGIGIKSEEIEKSINKNKTDERGTLYNARKLITVMGGSLLLSSNYNEGTKVTIVLDQKINTNKEIIDDKYDKYLENKKILVVDDNISSQKLIKKILKDKNTKIETVSLGKECLDKIRNKEKYDLLLIDEEMPYIDGEELIKKLKQIKGFNTKTILLTKDKNIEYDDRYLELGFDDYVLKPIDKNKLINKISKYLK